MNICSNLLQLRNVDFNIKNANLPLRHLDQSTLNTSVCQFIFRYM